ncbi:MAG: PD-(D/E)XK nuclease family protein [bacterium]|nr:PD-(D/E)XK nuclease family protein [bacterium]
MIPDDFSFSQTSLQDFADCPSRFDLRYLKRVNTPAAESEPLEAVEAHMQRGAVFHSLIHQLLIGVPPDEIAATIPPDDDALAGWWGAFLDTGLRDLPEQRTPEITLTTTLAGRRLVAKYDLLAVSPGAALVIVDWKTALTRPSHDALLKRLQTRVYRLVLVEAGARLNGGQPVQPEQVKMIYWFAGFPDQPEVLAYSAAEYAADRTYLAALIDDIDQRGADDFPLTDDVRRCAYCQYRGLHDRGTVAGDFRAADAERVDAAAEAPDDGDTGFTLDQIAEIAF